MSARYSLGIDYTTNSRRALLGHAADHFHGAVPVCGSLSPEEVARDYEGITGQAIVECFRTANLNPLQITTVLRLS